jgi:hypothetical protein
VSTGIKAHAVSVKQATTPRDAQHSSASANTSGTLHCDPLLTIVVPWSMKSVAGGNEQIPYPVKPGTIPGLNKRQDSQLGLEMPIDGWG